MVVPVGERFAWESEYVRVHVLNAFILNSDFEVPRGVLTTSSLYSNLCISLTSFI